MRYCAGEIRIAPSSRLRNCAVGSAVRAPLVLVVLFGRHFAVAAGGIGPALSLINNKISFCSATALAQRVFARDINYLVSPTVKDQPDRIGSLDATGSFQSL